MGETYSFVMTAEYVRAYVESQDGEAIVEARLVRVVRRGEDGVELVEGVLKVGGRYLLR